MRWLRLASSVVALVGCAPELQTRVPGVRIVSARVAGMEAIVRAFELDFFGQRDEKPDWAEAMVGPIDAEIERVLIGLGSDTFDVGQPGSPSRNRQSPTDAGRLLAGPARSGQR